MRVGNTRGNRVPMPSYLHPWGPTPRGGRSCTRANAVFRPNEIASPITDWQPNGDVAPPSHWQGFLFKALKFVKISRHPEIWVKPSRFFRPNFIVSHFSQQINVL